MSDLRDKLTLAQTQLTWCSWISKTMWCWSVWFQTQKLKHMVQTWHETEHIPIPLCLWGFKVLQICWIYTFAASENVYIPLQVVYMRDEVTFLKEHPPQAMLIIHNSCEHSSTHPPTSVQKEKYFHFSLPFAASAFIRTLLLRSAIPCCPLRHLLKYFPGDFCSLHHWSLSHDLDAHKCAGI